MFKGFTFRGRSASPTKSPAKSPKRSPRERNTPSEEEEEEQFKLLVKIIEARELKVADKSSNSSDPFVIVKVKSQKQQTKVCDKSVNPKWGEDFVFGDESVKKKAKPLSGNETILFHVLDKDFVFNDDLGGVAVALADIKSSESMKLQEWLPLIPFEAAQAEAKNNSASSTKKKKTANKNYMGELLVSCQLVSLNEEEEDSEDESSTVNKEDLDLEKETIEQRPTSSRRSSESEEVKAEEGINMTRMPNTLVVNIIQGKNLLAADSGNTSDPYCTLTFGKKKKRTKPQRKTLNPQWNTEFVFDATDKAGHCLENDLVVKLYDDDLFVDDALGQIIIPFHDIKKCDPAPTWYEINSVSKKRKQHQILGEIQLAMSYNCDSQPSKEEEEEEEGDQPEDTSRKNPRMFSLRSFSPLRKSADTPNTARSEKTSSTGRRTSRSKSSTSADEPERSSRRKSTSFSILPEVVPPFKLTIAQAQGLRSADSNNSSDPYCIIKLAKEKHKTKTIKRSLNPVWNQEFSFGGKNINKKWKWEDTLKIQIYDADFISSDFLGEVSITLEDLFSASRESSKWLSVEDKRKRDEISELGSIEIMSNFDVDELETETDQRNAKTIPEAPVTPRKQSRRIEPVTIKILRARNLKSRDTFGKCDPYCVVSFKSAQGKSRKLKSRVIQNTVNPDWGENELLSLDEIDVENLIRGSGQVSVRVMDKDIFTSDFVGKAELNLIQAIRITEPQWIPLEPKGELLLQIIASSELMESLHEPEGKLSAESVLQQIQRNLLNRNETLDSLRKAFELFDKDHSGYMDFEEFKQLIAFFKLSESLSERDLNTLFHALDESKDGKILFEELELLLGDSTNQAHETPEVISLGKSNNLKTVVEHILKEALRAREGRYMDIPDATEDFVADLRRNFDLFDENKSRQIEIGDRLNRVLVLSKSVAITDPNDKAALGKAFGSPMRYAEFCEYVLDYKISSLRVETETKPEVRLIGLPEDKAQRQTAVLKVKVVKAENLRAADWDHKSDPYCVLRLGKESKKTKVIRKSLNPEWGQDFILGKKNGLEPGMVLTVLIEDKDLIFSDSLGLVKIPIDTMPQHKGEEKWYTIESDVGKAKATGKILISAFIDFEGPASASASPPLKHVDDYVDGMEFEEPLSPASAFSDGNSVRSSDPMKRAGGESLQWHDLQLKEVREAVAKAIRANGGRSSLREELERQDVRQKGYISLKRLQAGLKSFGVGLTQDQVATILPRVDPEGIDRIDYILFCKVVRAEGVFASQKNKAAILESIKSRMERVLTRAGAKKMGVGALFVAFDLNQSGLVREHDFVAVMRAIDGQFEPKEVMLLAHSIDGAEQGGFVNYKTLIKVVCPSLDLSAPLIHSNMQNGFGRSGGLVSSTDEVINKFKFIIRRLTKHGAKQNSNIGKIFEQFDANGDGKISKTEFRTFVEKFVNEDPTLLRGELITEEEMEILMLRFDLHQDGNIDYLAFLSMVSLSKEELEGSIERLRKRLQAKSRKRQKMREPALLSEFSKVDVTGSGTVSRREFRSVLRSFGEESSLSFEELRYLMDKFDTFNSGSVKYQDFVDFVHGQPVGPSSEYLFQNSAEIEPFEVDRIMRGYVETKPMWSYTSNMDDINEQGTHMAMIRAVEDSAEHNAGKVNLWHPSTIGEWLEKYASPAERRDFDELYKAVSTFQDSTKYGTSVIRSPRQPEKSSPLFPADSPRIRHVGTKFAESPRQYMSLDHSSRRSPSPMDRDCRSVAWECKGCRATNRSLRNLNDCRKCGAIRTASSRVVVTCDDNGSVSSTSSSDSESSHFPKRSQRGRSSRKNRRRRHSRSRSRKRHSSERHKRGLGRKMSHSGLLPPSPRIFVVDDLRDHISRCSDGDNSSDSSSSSSTSSGSRSSSSTSSLSSSGLRSVRSASVFSDNFWGNVNAQRSANIADMERKEKRKRRKEKKRERKADKEKRDRKKKKKKQHEKKKHRHKSRHKNSKEDRGHSRTRSWRVPLTK